MLFYRTNNDVGFTVDDSSDKIHVLVNISDHDANSHSHKLTNSSEDNDLDDSSDQVHVLVDISDNDENPHALAITNSSAENDLDGSSDKNRVLVDMFVELMHSAEPLLVPDMGKYPNYAHQKTVLDEMQKRFEWEEIENTEKCRPEVQRHHRTYRQPLQTHNTLLVLDESFCPVICSSELERIKQSYPEISIVNNMENVDMCVNGDANTVCMGVHAKSDVYMQYFSWHEIDFFRIHAKRKPIGFLCSFVSNCISWRFDFLNAMTSVLRDAQKLVRHYGVCLHDSDSSPGAFINTLQKYEQKTALALQHLYTFAFENSEKEGYVTEKMFYLLADGIVPVYRGAPDIRKYLPSRECAVLVHSNDTPLQVAQQLLRENQTMYEKRGEWKTSKLELAWVSRMDISIRHSNCRLCIRIQSIITLPPKTGLWIRERGFSHHLRVPDTWKSDTTTIESVFLDWVYILDSNLTRHEKNMKAVGGFAILEVYRTWDIHKCRIDSLLELQILPEGTELEVILENPQWKYRENYPLNTIRYEPFLK